MKYLKAALTLALLLIFTASGAAERVEDNFEDGDYTSDPAWSVSGSSTVQVVNDGADGSTYALEIQNGNGDTTVHYDRGTSHDVDGHTYGYWLRPTTSGEQVRVGLSNSVADNIYDAEDAVWIRTWSDKQAQLVSNDGTSWGASKSSLGPSNPGTDYYYFTIAFDTVNSEATAKMYDTSMNQVGSATVPMYGPDYLQYAWMSSSTGTLHTDDADYSLQSQNKNPQFDSSNFDPDPLLIDNPVSYNASTSDPDGSIQETCLKVNWKGSQVYQSCKASSTPTWPDVYNPGSTGWLNATLNTTNEQGNTTSTEINRLLSKNRFPSETWGFTTCGSAGRYGPSQSQCENSYQETNLEGEVNIVDEGVQEWTVPQNGTYRIIAAGAQGGWGAETTGSSDEPRPGGTGAIVKGNVNFTKGEKLEILSGQRGDNQTSDWQGAGGGGASYVKSSSSSQPIIVAAGGAGSMGDWTNYKEDKASEFYGAFNQYTSDSGGGSGTSGSCGGAGWNQDGGSGNECTGGNALSDNAVGGKACYDGDCANGAGGFGGGGGGDYYTAGGGGAGYKGGKGSGSYSSGGHAHGGYSYNNASSDKEIIAGPGGDNPDSYGDRGVGNEGPGYVKVKLVSSTLKSSFCNYRGPFNECIMNKTNQLDQDSYNVSSIFESRESSVFEALNGRAEINIFNSSSISGLWRGAFNINAQSPRLEAGTRFRPENGRIKIGN